MWVVKEKTLKAEMWRVFRASWCMCLGSGPPRLDIEWLKDHVSPCDKRLLWKLGG